MSRRRPEVRAIVVGHGRPSWAADDSSGSIRGSTRYNRGPSSVAAPRAMHIHILGICGTFMGGLAVLARAAGHRVTGCDAGVYPPMSTQLEARASTLIEGWDPSQLDARSPTCS